MTDNGSIFPAGAVALDYPLHLLRLGAVRRAALLAADAVALPVAFAVAALSSLAISEWLLNRPYRDVFDEETMLRFMQFGGFGLCLVLGLLTKGHYRQRLPFWTEAKHVVAGCALMLLCDGFLMFALKTDFSRLWLVQAWVCAAVLMLATRRLARAVLDGFGCWRIPVLMVGDGDDVTEACQALCSERSLGYEVVGTVPLASLAETVGERSWAAVYEMRRAQLVVLALSGADFVERGEMITELVREGLPFAVVPKLSGLPVLGFDRFYFFSHDIMLLMARNNLAQPLSRAIKVTFDIVVAAALALVLLPAFAAFAALVARDGGPVLYRHWRVGRDGRPFACLKFRTMVTDGDRVLEELLAHDPSAEAEWRCSRKLKNDPRVTPVGRFLRATSLDELPQLFNVLRGEMSLVGPRPVTKVELEHYGRDLSFYLQVRPGMTGLWQVSGRNDSSYRQRIHFDVWYVKNWSLWHDMAILAKTLPVVVRRVGAY